MDESTYYAIFASPNEKEADIKEADALVESAVNAANGFISLLSDSRFPVKEVQP